MTVHPKVFWPGVIGFGTIILIWAISPQGFGHVIVPDYIASAFTGFCMAVTGAAVSPPASEGK